MSEFKGFKELKLKELKLKEKKFEINGKSIVISLVGNRKDIRY